MTRSEEFWKSMSKLIPGQPVRQGLSDGELIAALEDREVARGPMQNAPEAEDLLEITLKAGIRRESQTVLSVIASTGISPSQIRSWSPERIADFCRLQEEAAKDREPEPRMF